MKVSRRQLMLTGAGSVAAAAAGSVIAPTAARAETPIPGTIPDTAALIAVSDSSTAMLRTVVNQDTSTTVQSFAFDSVNGRFYTLQIAGASQVAYLKSGSQVAVTASIGGDQHETSGDMCLTQHDMTGAITGHMYLLGFGHGVSLGVEPANSGAPAYLWTEANAATDGYGQEIVRFPFAASTVLWTSHPSVRRLPRPEPDATLMTPSVDVTHNLFVIRYVIDGGHWFAAYRLDDARTAAMNGTPLPTPMARIQQPPLFKADATGAYTGTAATFQGFTTFGRYCYMLDGDPRTSDPAQPLSGVDQWAVHTTSMDLNGTLNGPVTGYISRTHSEADANADPREPEGMAVYTGAGTPRLCFGLTNNTASGTRQFDMYYKV